MFECVKFVRSIPLINHYIEIIDEYLFSALNLELQ